MHVLWLAALSLCRTIIIASIETLFIAKGRVCFLPIAIFIIKFVYYLVKAIQFYIQQPDLIKLQLAENKHGLLR